MPGPWQIHLAHKLGLKGVVLRGYRCPKATLIAQLNHSIKYAVDLFSHTSTDWVRRESMVGGEIYVFLNANTLEHFGPQIWPIEPDGCVWLDEVPFAHEVKPRVLKWATDRH